MPANKIMLIRHAEKPSDDGKTLGITEQGKQDAEELVVRGWQRAGALVRFFSPPAGRFSHQSLATPDFIFATGIGKHSNSVRPQRTVSVLASYLEKNINVKHLAGDETAMVTDALACNGTVLISWHHEAIPTIARIIIGVSAKLPKKWPDDRFDLLWIFDRASAAQPWNFTQVPQMLLPGDSPDVIHS